MATEATEDSWLLQRLATQQEARLVEVGRLDQRKPSKVAVQSTKPSHVLMLHSSLALKYSWSEIHFSWTLQKNAWKSPCLEDKEGQDASTYHENSVLRRKGQGRGAAGGKGCPEAPSFALPGLSSLFPVKQESKSKANSDKEKPFVPE